jgi:prepilin signal peptidase PulO-like enzyme (type II secretory pathway)
MLNYLMYLILGICGAWLVNYLADTLPQTRQLTVLHCSNCDEELGWRSVILYTPCENCNSSLSWRHLTLLISLSALSILVGIFPIQSLGPLVSILWLIYFSLIVVIDLEHRLILHPVSLTGAILGLLTGIWIHGFMSTLLGGVAGFVIMLLFYYAGGLFVRVLSKRRGEPIQEVALGFGDVNLAGIMGLLLGWPGVVGGIFLAVILGGLVSGLFMIIQLARKKYQAYQALPYGPFLAVSVFLLFYISQIVR